MTETTWTMQEALDVLKDSVDGELYKFIEQHMVGEMRTDVLHHVFHEDHGRDANEHEVELYILCSLFGISMFWKAIEAEHKYNFEGAWKKDDWKDTFDQKFAYHVLKGDPRDVALFCAFADHHRWSVNWPDDLEQSAHELLILMERDKNAKSDDEVADHGTWWDAYNKFWNAVAYHRYRRSQAIDSYVKDVADEHLAELERLQSNE